MKRIVFIFSIALLFAACETEHVKSETIKQAEQVHEQMIADYGAALTELETQKGLVSDLLEKAQLAADTALVEQYQSSLLSLNQIAEELAFWDENLLEVPGHAHVHEDGEVCEHDHAEDAMLEGMTDADILRIQKEQQEELNGLKQKLGEMSVQA